MRNQRKVEMEMDELKLKLSTRFMRGMVAKLVAKTISKKLGYDIDILLNEIEIKTEDGKVKLHLNIDAQMDNEEFKKVVTSIGLD